MKEYGIDGIITELINREEVITLQQAEISKSRESSNKYDSEIK